VRDVRREVTMATAIVSDTTLSAADRCDRCGAQAYLRVALHTGGELNFCAHHAREHGDRLRAIATVVVDDTHKLADTSATAADGEH
jgi:hypothetical protein